MQPHPPAPQDPSEEGMEMVPLLGGVAEGRGGCLFASHGVRGPPLRRGGLILQRPHRALEFANLSLHSNESVGQEIAQPIHLFVNVLDLTPEKNTARATSAKERGAD